MPGDIPRFVGARVLRVEDPRFLTGRGRYVDDIELPGMVHVAFVRSDHGHAELRDVSVEEARAIDGVIDVVTAADLADEAKPIRARCSYPGYVESDQPLLCANKVRMVGDSIAAVVATSRHVAEDGVDAVKVSYEPLPAINSIETALAEGAPVIHEEMPDNKYVTFHRVTGDVDGAFAAADHVIEREFRTQRYAAVCLEPRATIAQYDVASHSLITWMSTQTPHLLRSGLSECLGIPETRIRVIAPDVGGGFGQKCHLFPEDVVLAVLSKRLDGRPVKWQSDRLEDLKTSAHAREQRHRIKAAFQESGQVTAINAEVVADNGAYSTWPWSAALDCGQASDNMTGPYDIPNYERRAMSIVTNKAPVGPYRGVGRPHACFSIERIMDAIASELGKDPAAVRELNLVKKFPYDTPSGFHLESGSYIEALRLAQAKIGYEELRRRQAELRGQGRDLGIGIACNVEQSAHGAKEMARKGVTIVTGYDTAAMRVEPDGKVTLALGLHNHGQGTETTMAQIAADELGLPVEDINVVFGDTAVVSYGMGTFASRSTVYCGGATVLAARDVCAKAMRIAASMLEAAPEDLEMSDGRISVKGVPSRFVSMAAVAKRANHEPDRLPDDIEAGLEATRKYAAPDSGSFSNAVHIAVVEVDREIGVVEILRYVVVEDCGTMVNPLIIEGQIHGGVAQGLGGAFLEELVYDEAGQLLSGTLVDYLLPSFTDVPEIEVEHLETPSPLSVGGFKGMGEGGAINPGAAIANAVSDALAPLGAEVNQTPVSPEYVTGLVSGSEGAA